jgi:thiamine transport system permease protein
MLRIVLGGAVLIALLLFSLGTALVVGLQGRGLAALNSADWSAVKFTLWQASLSAVLSTAMAIPVARALARQSFPGRQALITLLGAPFILPVIVGVLGLLAVFGRAGWISAALDWAGFAKLSIYGAPGVILAHVFFNLPLVTRLLLQAWTAIPAERFRVAESLGATPWAYFRLIEWPMLRATVPGAFLLVFLLCLTSFVVALAVGGGPKGTTIELAIYQAFRLDFDLGKAASLALVQFTICGAVSLLAFLVPLPQTDGLGFDRVVQRLDGPQHRIWDGLWISVASAFLVLPLGAVLMRGLRHMLEVPSQIFAASLTSLTIAIISTALCLGDGFDARAGLCPPRITGPQLGGGHGYFGAGQQSAGGGNRAICVDFPLCATHGFCLADYSFGQCNDGFALCSACLDAYGSRDLWRLSSFAHESWNGALDLDDTDLSAAPASPNRVFGWPCGGALDGGSWRDRAFCGS